MDDEPIVPFRGICDNCNKHIYGEVLKTVDTECLERYFCSMDCFCQFFSAEWIPYKPKDQTMKWKSVGEEFPRKNQLCLCRKPYTYKEDFWFDYDYSICVYIEYEWFILETNTTCYLYDFTEWVSMDDVEESMESKK